MSKTKRVITFFPLIICLAYTAAINVCEARPVKAQKPKNVVELKFSTGFSADHAMQALVFENWAKKINELSNGAVVVKFFPAGALGKNQYELAEKGIADIVYTLHAYTPGRFKMIEIFELPFMISKAEKASTTMWTIYEKFPQFRKEYKGVKVLALFCHPPGHFFTIEKPITQISDFKGVRFRTVNPFVTSALKIFGAIPVSMPANETRDALTKGIVRGATFPWEGVCGFKLDDLVRFGTIADFYTATMMVVMNQEKYNSLPENIKKIIDQNTGMVLSKECGYVFDTTDEPFRQQALKKGVVEFGFPPKEKQKLEAFTMPLRVRWVKDMESKGFPGKEVLKTTLELLGKK